jgi:hypothetical protein
MLMSRAAPSKTLTAPIVHFMSSVGAVKTVVESATQAANRIAN